MKRDLIDAIGKIDPRYIEEAAAVRKQAEASFDKTRTRAAEEAAPVILHTKKRSGWAVAAAALFLVLSVGTAWTFLSGKNVVGVDPSYVPGDSPAQTGGMDPSGTDLSENLLSPEETAAPPELHELQIDFNTLLASTDSEDIAFAVSCVTSRTPSAVNEMTGLFAGKNLILITANSLSPEVIDPERTPTLYRLATKGIEFTDYYQPAWGGTSSGEFAFLTGLVPVNGVQSMKDTIGKNMCLTMGNQLRQQGYFSRAYTDYFSYDYEHQGLTLPNLGYDELLGIGNGLDFVMTDQWPYSDREMMDVVISQIDGMEPFSVCCMTCSGMGTYDVWGNKMAEKHWSEVEDLPYSDKVKGYLAANMEIEYALQDLVSALEDAGIADDTVIVLTSSQYPYALEENEDWGNTEDYLAELYGYKADDVFKRDHSTLIVWSGCLEGKNIKVTTPTSSLDVLPTLSNLFGLEYDSRLFVGGDVFSDREPFVFWPDGSWKTDKACYNAKTKTCSSSDGSELSEQYLRPRYEAVTASVDYSAAVLKTDLFALLFPPLQPSETIDAEPQLPPEMSMEELEAKLGYGWELPEAGTYPGEIVSKFDDSLGENGGILLEYRFDDFVVYAAKYADDGTYAYESWAWDSAERGSETINGVEVRFLGEPTVPDYRDTAFWEQNGYQYILNCATAPGVDIMSVLPLFMEDG